MAGVKIVDLPALGRDLINTDLLEVSLNGGGSRKITGQEIMNASKLAIGSTPIVAGTVGRLLFQGTGNVLQQSGNLFWDNPNLRLGIGISTPLYTLDVAGNIHGNSIFAEYNIVSSAGNVWLGNGYAIGDYGTGNNRIEFYSNRLSFFGNGNEALRIVGSTGNLLVNTVTDAGFRLDVNGTARVQGKLTVSTGGFDLTGTLTNFSAYQGYGSMQLFSAAPFQMFNSANNSKASFQYTTATGLSLSINPENLSGVLNGLAIGPSLVASANNNLLIGLQINSTYSASTFTGVNYFGLVVGSTSGRSLRFQRDTITVGPFQRNSINAYNGSGSDALFIQDAHNGAVYIGNGGGEVQLNGSGKVYTGSGNLLVNTTTDAGFRLDVNGTARVQGAFSSTSSITAQFGFIQLGSNANTFPGIINHMGAAQSVAGLNTTRINANTDLSVGYAGAPDASAVIQANSTTKGFLPPRMTNAQRAAIASPAVGLIVYCTDATEGLYVYKSTGWTFMV